MSQDGPLPPGTLDELKARLGDLDTAQVEVEKARRAGLPVEDAEKLLGETRVKLNRVRQVYFPGK